MTTAIHSQLDFSAFPESDGQPMAETVANMNQMYGLYFGFRTLLESQGRTNVAVGSNQFVYYNETNGRDHCAPDVYVALDVPPGDRPVWKTWIEGKFPDIVFEISSPSTMDEDLTTKRHLYARLKASEYYIYDPQQVLKPPFQGFEARGGKMVPLPKLPSGGILSLLLGAELRPIGTVLRVIDPVRSVPILVPDELKPALAAEALARAEAEEQLLQERRTRYAVEERIVQERLARDEAEERAAAAEAQIQALLRKLAERDS